jgi:hypothetical protein
MSILQRDTLCSGWDYSERITWFTTDSYHENNYKQAFVAQLVRARSWVRLSMKATVLFLPYLSLQLFYFCLTFLFIYYFSAQYQGFPQYMAKWQKLFSLSFSHSWLLLVHVMTDTPLPKRLSHEVKPQPCIVLTLLTGSIMFWPQLRLQTVHDRIYIRSSNQTFPGVFILDCFFRTISLRMGTVQTDESTSGIRHLPRRTQNGLKCCESHGQISLEPSPNKNRIARVQLADSAPTNDPS